MMISFNNLKASDCIRSKNPVFAVDDIKIQIQFFKKKNAAHLKCTAFLQFDPV